MKIKATIVVIVLGVNFYSAMATAAFYTVEYSRLQLNEATAEAGGVPFDPPNGSANPPETPSPSPSPSANPGNTQGGSRIESMKYTADVDLGDLKVGDGYMKIGDVDVCNSRLGRVRVNNTLKGRNVSVENGGALKIATVSVCNTDIDKLESDVLVDVKNVRVRRGSASMGNINIR